MNTLGGHGLWDEEDGFYYDQVRTGGVTTPLKLRSMVGLIPLFAVDVLEKRRDRRACPGFRKRLTWFLSNRGDLYQQISMMEATGDGRSISTGCWRFPSRERLVRVLARLLDEKRVSVAVRDSLAFGRLRRASLHAARGRRRSAP